MSPTLFTTARVRAGRVVHADLHRTRLTRDATFVAPTLVPLVDDAMLQAKTAAKELEDGSVRISMQHHAATVTSSLKRRKTWRDGDAPLEIAQTLDPRQGDALWVKTENRTAWDDIPRDALLVGPRGEVREGTWFHVAFHIDNAWVLPPLGCGVIFGVTRAWFLAREGTEQTLTHGQLAHIDGALALSSLLGVAPIASIGGERVKWGKAAKTGARSLALAHLE